MNNFSDIKEKLLQKLKSLKNSRNIFRILLLIIIIAVFFYSAYNIVKTFTPPDNNLSGYRSEVTSDIPVSSPSGNVSESNNSSGSEVSIPGQTAPPIALPDNPVDFNALKQRNPDVCGWIYMPGSDEVYGTLIDYPILQSSPDKKEDFYLNHDIDGQKLFDGSIYIQRINNKDFSDKNTVIYGHDLYNKSMFTPLRKYRNRDFFEKHPDIYIYTPGNIMKYTIISVSLFSDAHILYQYDFSTEEGTTEYLNDILETSRHALQVRKNIEVTAEDTLITLSTCTNKKHERLIVAAVLDSVEKTK